MINPFRSLTRIILFFIRRRRLQKFQDRKRSEIRVGQDTLRHFLRTKQLLKKLRKPRVFFVSSPIHYVPQSRKVRAVRDVMRKSRVLARLAGQYGHGDTSSTTRPSTTSGCGFGDDIRARRRNLNLDLNRNRRGIVLSVDGLTRELDPIPMRSPVTPATPRFRRFSTSAAIWRDSRTGDAAEKDEGDRRFVDDFREIRENYATPKYPIVLAHGLMGFSELRIAGKFLPGIAYWRGITEAMTANKIEVIITSVPPSGSIEERAAKLKKDIISKAGGKKVNIIAHSMGGLDARYMISKLMDQGGKIDDGNENGDGGVEVASLTTIATPHRGSAVADYVVGDLYSSNSDTKATDPKLFEPQYPKPEKLPPSTKQILFNFLSTLGLSTAAFSQLTRSYLRNTFNPSTPNIDSVRYFSYGASFNPKSFNAFKFPHGIMVRAGEGDNDGLVSVESSKWGSYKGTLVDVDHLDLINWTNRLKWIVREGVGGDKENFNALAFYLDVADMLAREGL